MKYLLDTCAVSDFIKGEPNTLDKLKSISPNNICLSSITVMEIEYGLALNTERAAAIRTVIEDFLSVITILSFTQRDARFAAAIRAQLKITGNPIGSYDVLLAGAALSRDYILVTSNLREFKRVSNLKIENWRRHP